MDQSIPSPLKGEILIAQVRKISSQWQIKEEHHLEREYRFKNFKEALEFTNIVGGIAEREKHHPDIFLSFGTVKIKIWTHKINGLTEKDFDLAKKLDLIRL